MKIGLFTDSLGHLPFETALEWIAAEGIEAVEIGTGNFSPAPHSDLQALLERPDSRQALLGSLAQRGLQLSALNCSGNLLDPDKARREAAQAIFRNTIAAARELGVGTVITMSGCPGDLGGGAYPNWVTCTWQREYVQLLERQWKEEIEPFWQEAGALAAANGVRIAIEMHPGQAVYNTRTLQRLREIAGPVTLGANLDPSHLFFQNMDPLIVLESLGPGAVFHVHAKDTRINTLEMARNGSLDTRPMGTPGERAWEYVTLGYGHGALFWRQFLAGLRMIGYDGVLSIEHEDPMMSAEEGIRKSVAFLWPLLLQTTGEAQAEAP